ncbi:helix-turn-helix domain-containing protein [Lipingzhangella sp. LS1_29]|uniref:Helix-turn-helix domain-containing protein n=1 Tax=Lipingzhangella rawalii TaxID=2055835 RepID=A0ABU2HA99_9ACTN|nr:helix-turn-helix domain-containing protein [Lipingzhangella rawalii]MDS1271770.1 helix-turn-helix domain-containing protein [Lipingzhangella rawalii]
MPPTTPPKRLYRIAEAAQILSLGRTQIFKEIAHGRLRAVGCGKTRRIPAEAIEDYVELLTKEAEAA